MNRLNEIISYCDKYAMNPFEIVVYNMINGKLWRGTVDPEYVKSIYATERDDFIAIRDAIRKG